MSDRPNILLIMTDQQRGDWLRVAGHPLIETPHIDQLADEGVLFARGYSECPVCIPARYVLMTGLHPESLDLRANRNVPMPIVETLPYMLGRAGYQTQSVGKTHFTPQRACYGFDHTVVVESGRMAAGDDFHHWLASTPYAGQERLHALGNNMVQARRSALPESHHVTTWTASESLRYLDRRDPTRPFFLHCSFTKPHSPYDPPAPYDTMYDPQDVPDPYVPDIAPEDLPPSLRTLPLQYGWDRLRRAEVRRIRAHYMGEITHIDAQVGRLIGGLAARGLLENTLVVFASDHGDMMGDRGLFFKTTFYEGSMRVPFVLSAPRAWGDRALGRVVDTPVGLADLLPTLLEAAGVEDVRPRDGRSLLGFSRGETPFSERVVHSVYGHGLEDVRHCVTDGKTKYIWNRRGGFEELYRPAEDPAEAHNLALDASCRAELARWRATLVETLAREGATYCLEGGALAPLPTPEAPESRSRARDPFGRRDF
jgi:arylsulfatase